jgi:hypothetical protein
MKLLIGLAIAVVSIYGAYKLAYPTYTHRYRLSVELEIDGIAKRGSNVIEVRAWSQPKLLPDFANVLYRSYGEAIHFKLERGPTLIVLLASRGPPVYSAAAIDFLVLNTFGEGSSPLTLNKFIAATKATGSRELTGVEVPPFVAVPDIADPQGAYWLPLERLQSALDKRVAFKSASIEMLASAPSGNAPSIEQLVRWLDDEAKLQAFWKAVSTSGLRISGTDIRNLLIRR